MKRIVTKHTINHKPEASDFESVNVELPRCLVKGVLVRVVYLSLDPYIGSTLRGRHFAHATPEPLIEAPPASVVAQVIESQSDKFNEGDWVYALNGLWQEYLALEENEIIKIAPKVAPLSAYAGILGIPGLTAWASASQLAKIKEGDTVLVNAAAGSVGGTFGQLARSYGAKRIVGIAGGSQKCRVVTEQYGFDDCIDYKAEGWKDALKEALPEGLSVFHENVSAEMAMLALSHAQLYARGVLCGLADAYQSDTQQSHPINAGFVIFKRAQLSGLVVYDFMPKWNQFVEEVSAKIKSREVVYIEDRVDGLEQAPVLFEKLMNGQNIGKPVVKVASESS